MLLYWPQQRASRACATQDGAEVKAEMKAIRYKGGSGDCVWTTPIIQDCDEGLWVVFSPCNDGIGIGDTREAAIADAARCVCMTVEEFKSDPDFCPVACAVHNDSILVGQIEDCD